MLDLQQPVICAVIFPDKGRRQTKEVAVKKSAVYAFWRGLPVFGALDTYPRRAAMV